MAHPGKLAVAMAAITLIAAAGCSRQETLSETNADIAKAQAEKADDVNDALKSRADVAAETAADAMAADPDDRGDAIEARAEAAYDVAMARAEGDRNIGKQSCDSLPKADQSACNKRVEDIFDNARAQAKATLDAARTRSNVVQKLDNR